MNGTLLTIILGNYNDGKRIYNNRLKFYPKYRPDMVLFQDLFKESAGISENKENSLNKKPESIVLASFLVEDKFIGKHIISQGIECTIFKHGYMDTDGARGKSVLDYPNIKMRLVLPDLKTKYSVFHPKVMLIKFDTFLRVVITTANLLERDWEELGQLVWFQDFPYIVNSIVTDSKDGPKNEETNSKSGIKTKETTKFTNVTNSNWGTHLKKFFHDILPSSRTVTVKPTPKILQCYEDKFDSTNEQQEPEPGKTFREVIRGDINLDNYDFSNCYIDLVSSISGYHDIESGSADDQGMIRIKNLMKNCNADDYTFNEATQITYQSTSYGRIYPKMLNEFIYNILGGKLDIGSILLKNHLKFIFPEESQVLASHLGSEVSCLKLREDFWMKQADFPKYLFHKFDFKDEFIDYNRNVHHSKVMVIKDKDKEIDDSTAIYIGSHNMSGGAWGTVQRYGKTLFIGNYELGIFFKPRKGSKEIKQRIVNSLLFKTDPTPYDIKNDRPYMFTDPF